MKKDPVFRAKMWIVGVIIVIIGAMIIAGHLQ